MLLVGRLVAAGTTTFGFQGTAHNKQMNSLIYCLTAAIIQ